VVTILNQTYEVDFKGFSYGFRPGRSPRQALDALYVGIQRKRVKWVLDADIRGFFDNMSHEWTMKFIEHRVADRITRLGPRRFAEVRHLSIRAIVARLSAEPLIRMELGTFVGCLGNQEYVLGSTEGGPAWAIQMMNELRREIRTELA
jgi:hypothetical protein